MKISRHVIFWIIVILLLTFIFGRSYRGYTESFHFVSMLLPVIVGTTYYFNYFLVPKYLFRKKYFKFVLYCIYLLIISLNFEMIVITTAFIVLAEYNYANMNPITTDAFVLVITLYFVVLSLAFLRLVRFYFRGQKSLNQVETELEKSSQKYLVVKENRKNKQIRLDSIDYLESLGDYVRIHSSHGEKTVTKEKISNLDNRLPNNFIRVHRSFIVNKNKISTFNRDCLIINEMELPISRTYKIAAVSSLNN